MSIAVENMTDQQECVEANDGKHIDAKRQMQQKMEQTANVTAGVLLY